MTVMVPAAMVPAQTPNPVTVMPTTVPAPMPMTVPAHFFRLDTSDVVLRDDGRFGGGGRGNGLQFSRHRRQRCGLRRRGKHGAASHKAHRYLQKVPTFHDFSPFLKMERGRTLSPLQ